MKRLATILALSLFFLSILHAAPVDRETARQAAEQWMLQNVRSEHSGFLTEEIFAFTRDEVTTHYLVNLIPGGFVIVAGDDIAVPIWMYHTHGRYDGNSLPPSLAGMLDAIAEDLITALRHGEKQDTRVGDMWRPLRENGNPQSSFRKGTASIMAVSPLLTTTWNQTFPYNKDCPATPTGGSGGHVYVGCVATAMAQVMRFYNFPTSGTGSHSYVHATYGTQSANFGSTTYDWANMPVSVSSSSSTAQKDAVAQLSYHCGVAVEMDYGPTGSASSIFYASQALPTFFRYKTSISHLIRSSYATSTWLALLIDELDDGRPVIYRGSEQNGTGGHAFIVDGYTGSDYFHMNFGWGGYLDGYFYLNDITPGSNNFNYWQKMVIGIQPDQSAPPTLLAPTNQSNNLCTSPTFTWSAAPGVTSYRMQIATDAAFNSIVHDNASLTGTSTQVTGLSRGTLHYWRMNSTGTAGTSAWTTPWSFTTMQVAVSASGATTFCDGGDVTLTTIPAPGGSCQWMRNSTPIQGSTQSSLLVTQSGSYSVSVTLNGCATESDPVTVTVHPVPTAEILPPQSTEICEGGSSMLIASQSSGYAYQWLKDGQNIPGATGSTYSASESGVYSLTVSANGCTDVSDTLRVVVHPVDPTELEWTGSVSSEWYTPGNWDNPCAVPSSGDNVTIPPGCSPPASIPPCTLNNLTVDNGTGTSLSGNVMITGTLSMQNGHISLGDNDLTISASGEISGGSANGHIITNGVGQLRQLGLGTTGRYRPVTFPVGHGSGVYLPLRLSNAAPANDFAVRLLDEVRDGGLIGNPLSGGLVENTWIVAAGNGSTNLTMDFFWSAASEGVGFDRSACFISRNDNGQAWNALSAPSTAMGIGPFSLTATGVTTISTIGVPFCIGSSSSLYPVELLSFSGTMQEEGILLEWRTQNEVGNFGFEIQHHVGSDTWRTVGFIPAAEEHHDICAYRFLHPLTDAGRHFYRLRQIDADGSSTYSQVLYVERNGLPSSLQCEIFPNPIEHGTAAMLQLRSGREGTLRVTLYDALGRPIKNVFEGFVSGSSTRMLAIPTEGLPTGMYFLRVDGSTESRMLRMQLR
ncbi:MAG: thiol protease/hemagglutinin PrtT [Bacteroidetes bacterium]|nr:thiol protease/hemagglutinin PrtT [Bacteroidota bacterium]